MRVQARRAKFRVNDIVNNNINNDGADNASAIDHPVVFYNPLYFSSFFFLASFAHSLCRLVSYSVLPRRLSLAVSRSLARGNNALHIVLRVASNEIAFIMSIAPVIR